MVDKTSPSISAVLPAYNEEAVIGETVMRVSTVLAALGLPDFEVIVVDDGSGDGTGDIVTSLARDDPHIRLQRHTRNRGYGAALRTGFDAASMDATWLMDSDGQFDPADIGLLLAQYTPKTAVWGYRVHRRDPLLRRANHAAFFTVVDIVLGSTARDVNCAFKLFPSEVGKSLRAEGAMISTELVLRAKKRGYDSVEVGVPHYPRTAGKATGANPGVVVRAFAELWSMRKNDW